MRDLFEHQAAGVEIVPLADASLRFYRGFLANGEAQTCFNDLLWSIPWTDQEVVVWGKRHMQPRRVAWFGDGGASYMYSGSTMVAQEWTTGLLTLRRKVEASLDATFNSVLLNLYRDENDRMGWHSDNEPELGRRPVIASLSLGAPRIFQMKHKHRRELGTRSFELTPGSLLVMSGETQRHWLHGVRKETKPTAPRINLTFRNIRSGAEPAGH